MRIFKILNHEGGDARPPHTNKLEDSDQALKYELTKIYELFEAGGKENFRQALALSRKLIKDPNYPKKQGPYFVEGRSLIGLGDYKAAAESFSKSINIKFDDTEAYRHRACALARYSAEIPKDNQNEKRRLLARAIGDLYKAIEWEGDDNAKSKSKSYRMLAFIYKMLNEFDAAVEAINKAINLNPGNEQLIHDRFTIIN